NRFLVGWKLLSDGSARVAVVDSNAVVRSSPEVLSPAINWGARDDSYRARPDGSISWVQGASGSTTLKLHRYSEASVAVDEPPIVSEPASLSLVPPYPNPVRGQTAMLRFTL